MRQPGEAACWLKRDSRSVEHITEFLPVPFPDWKQEMNCRAAAHMNGKGSLRGASRAPVPTSGALLGLLLAVRCSRRSPRQGPQLQLNAVREACWG